ncbi:MAG: 2-C-methyl-D-erythritol 2,4-cyclodiphosphate synthase [Bacteroidales bacterium]
MRIGFGYDVHRLEPGRPLVIGGVIVPHHKGAAGHSDADVLIHAMMDALLGAAALGDIGRHFPDTDPQYKDADSKWLLEKVMLMLHQQGMMIGNMDATVCLQEPKIALYIPEMKRVLCELMQLNPDQLSIKATTTEKLGTVGREEGIAAQAVVLVRSSR